MVQGLAAGAFIIGVVVLGVFGLLWRRTAQRTALAARLQATEGLLRDIGYRKIRQQKGAGHYWVIYTGYEYSVGGKHFRGSRVSLDDDTFASEAAAATVVGDRKVGDKVVVWYDPISPARSALRRPPQSGDGFYRIGAIAGGVIAVAGAVAALAAR